MVFPSSLLLVILFFLLFVYTGSALLLLFAIFLFFSAASKFIHEILDLSDSDDSDTDDDPQFSDPDLDLEASIPLPMANRLQERRLHGTAAVIQAFAGGDPSLAAYLQQLLLQSSTVQFVYEQDFQQKLHMDVVNMDQECVICLSEFEEQEKLRILPDCKHCFHASCIETWLLSSNFTCPLCRSPVEPKLTPHQHRSTPTTLEPPVDHSVAVNANQAPEHRSIDMN